MITLTHKTICITGASSGIGRACAEVFAEAGARLLLIARREDALQALADDLHQRFHTETLVRTCDVRSRAAVATLFAECPEQWRDIDILINNAGLARGMDTIQGGDIDDWEAMIDTNIKGVLYVTKAVLPAMAERRSGMIINMGSIAGLEVYPKGNVYCATKAAVKALSDAMYIDTNGLGIRVCNIQPGMVETDFSNVRFHGDTERASNVYKGVTPLTGRDIAELALFAATRPAHVNLSDMVVYPVAQAKATIVHRG
jgi:3-hydroxy acid dehydrogenase / malonic semialdehyde reductase